MAQNRRTRGYRFKRVFREAPTVLLEEWQELTKGSDEFRRLERLARRGRSSNHFLRQVAAFFGVHSDWLVVR